VHPGKCDDDLDNLRRLRRSRGSDPRLLRLTMDGLLDRHIWGATPCIKDRPRPRLDLLASYAGKVII
jgi:hypothetical protein